MEAMRNEWMEKELNPLKTQVEELGKYKPKELTPEEKALEEKEAQLWEREVKIELSEAGCQDWYPFFNVPKGDTQALKAKIEQLKTLTNKIKTNNSYIPDSHKAQDKYSAAESAKDAIGMIEAKLSQLFK
jgi:hypothetical protein